MADDDKKSADRPFLARWSQRKQEAQAAPAAVLPAPAVADTPVPDLPPVEELTLQSDFSGFMHPKVDPDLRRAALRKLFSDPQFNVMDGLDTYIGDYSQPDPLPPGMLAGLRQAQNIIAWAQAGKEESAAKVAPPADLQAPAQQDEKVLSPAHEHAADAGQVARQSANHPVAGGAAPVDERKS